MDFSGEIEQHKGIHAALDRLVETIHSAQVDPGKFDAVAMQKLMKDFREPLVIHARCLASDYLRNAVHPSG